MTTRRAASSSGDSGGKVTVQQFYEVQLETNRLIADLEKRLVDRITAEIRSLEIPSKATVQEAISLAKEAKNRAEDVDRKTNWFGGINSLLAVIATYFGISGR